jgi:hypothetical protein
MFDSPISRCEAVREMVITDQTQAECSREHSCPTDRICPLSGYFSATSGIFEANLESITHSEVHCEVG